MGKPFNAISKGLFGDSPSMLVGKIVFRVGSSMPRACKLLFSIASSKSEENRIRRTAKAPMPPLASGLPR